MGPKIDFNMLPFIMFDSTPISGHGNNFERCKRYIVPFDRTKKIEEIRRILAFGTNI